MRTRLRAPRISVMADGRGLLARYYLPRDRGAREVHSDQVFGMPPYLIFHGISQGNPDCLEHPQTTKHHHDQATSRQCPSVSHTLCSEKSTTPYLWEKCQYCCSICRRHAASRCSSEIPW